MSLPVHSLFSHRQIWKWYINTLDSFYTFHLICENCLLTAGTFRWESFSPLYETVRLVYSSSQRETVWSQSGRAESQPGFPEGKHHAQGFGCVRAWRQKENGFFMNKWSWEGARMVCNKRRGQRCKGQETVAENIFGKLMYGNARGQRDSILRFLYGCSPNLNDMGWEYGG